MGKIVSRIPELLEKLGLTETDLKNRGLANNTAYRAARGETGLSLETIGKICDALGVTSLDELFTYVPDLEVGQGDEQDQPQAGDHAKNDGKSAG